MNLTLDENDIKAYIGAIIFMSISPVCQVSHYWSNNESRHNLYMSSRISGRRYPRYIHFWMFWKGTLRNSIHQINVCQSTKVWSHTMVGLVLISICQLNLPNMVLSFLPYAIRLGTIVCNLKFTPAGMQC